jgi:hypothetical protein
MHVCTITLKILDFFLWAPFMYLKVGTQVRLREGLLLAFIEDICIPVSILIPIYSPSLYIWPIRIYRYRKQDIGHIGIGICTDYLGYRPKYMDIRQILPNIGQNTNYRLNIGQHENIGIRISGLYFGANVLVLVSAKIWLGEYISIGWTHISPTLILCLGKFPCHKNVFICIR